MRANIGDYNQTIATFGNTPRFKQTLRKTWKHTDRQADKQTERNTVFR